MCGIAGLLRGERDGHRPAARAMDQAMAHRGPDGAGLWQSAPDAGEQVTLVHRRLAIQDLSPAGHQPMVTSDGRYVLVFNGEIYNQHAIRRDLERQGHQFHSNSDSEVLLQVMSRYGCAALQRLRGMYAFCLWDNRRQEALLARDPYGIKPLYIWQGPGGQLLFASEVRALLASGLIPRRLDAAGVAGFLAHGSVPEPRTLVAGVQSLPAGWMGTWTRGRWHAQPHWQPSYAAGLVGTPNDVVGHTRQALHESVQAHLVSDVPVGLFLSGGLDSSALLALAGGPNLTTLSIGFSEAGFDESARAAALADHFGSRHVPLQLGASQAAALLPSFLAAVDQPSVDGFNTFCVANLAAEQGLKVVLSGLGGDELFGGYPSFRKIPRLLGLHQRLGAARPVMAGVLARSRRSKHQRLAAFLRGPATTTAAHRCIRGLFAPAEINCLLNHWGLDAPGGFDARGGFDEQDALYGLAGEASESGGLAIDQAQQPGHQAVPQLGDAIAWLESSRYMGQQLLRDGDGFSMAHGLELRLPFVDSQLLHALAGLDAGTRLAADKTLLRRAVPELMTVLAAVPKQGFLFPFQRWFDSTDSPLSPGSIAYPLPPVPSSIDLSTWARRWGLMVLRQWTTGHLGSLWDAAQLDIQAAPVSAVVAPSL